MNALDQAFIKAFAKDPTVASSEQGAASTRSKTQPPEAGVESMALVLHDPQPQGRRLRIDRPTSIDASSLSAHLIMPTVEQVQSYQPADLATSMLAQVVVEDRLQALAEALRRRAESARDAAAAARETEPDDTSDEDASDPVAEAVKPLVSLAAARLYRPDLQHRQLACLLCRQNSRARGSTTTMDIGHFDLDPALFEGNVRVDRPEQAAQPEASPAAPCEDFADDLAERMSAASDIDDIVLPVREEDPPASHGLSDAEEAALLGEVVAPSTLEPLAPAWEVDAFRWPAVCTQLDEASGRKLAQSGDELYMAVQDGLKVVAVTSTERHEGRTTIALSLARSAATAGCRVALLDADGANPELARRLGLDSPCDWHQIRRRHQPLHEAAVASLDDRVTLFPLTVPDDDLSGRLDDPTLTGVLQELKGAFDLVVVDTQPVAEGDPRVAAATCPCEVDMVLVVRNVQTTPPEACLKSVMRLRGMGVRAVGIVENFAPAEEAAV